MDEFLVTNVKTFAQTSWETVQSEYLLAFISFLIVSLLLSIFLMSIFSERPPAPELIVFSWIPSSQLWRNFVGHWHLQAESQSCSSKDFLLCSPANQLSASIWSASLVIFIYRYQMASNLQWQESDLRHKEGKRPQHSSSFLQHSMRSLCPMWSPFCWLSNSIFSDCFMNLLRLQARI